LAISPSSARAASGVSDAASAARVIVSLVKRGKAWHCHFVVNGQRFRQSLGTKDWREAQAKEEELIGQAMEGRIAQTSTSLARQPFGLAADDYATSRKLELAPASQAKEKQLLVQLRAYFKQQPLKSITPKQIVEYRAWRAEQKVGPATLNAELGVLRRIMKRARIWARIADDVRPLREPSTIGKALTEDEKQRLLKTAAMQPEWETAYLAAILCLNTTARGCELKGLQWSDVDLFAKTLTIRKSKTAAGERVVPLTDVAASVLARLRRRAVGMENPDEESVLAGLPVPRSAALCHHTACREWRIRFDDHGDCRARQPSHAGTLQSRANGSEAESDGSPRSKHQSGGL